MQGIDSSANVIRDTLSLRSIFHSCLLLRDLFGRCEFLPALFPACAHSFRNPVVVHALYRRLSDAPASSVMLRRCRAFRSVSSDCTPVRSLARLAVCSQRRHLNKPASTNLLFAKSRQSSFLVSPLLLERSVQRIRAASTDTDCQEGDCLQEEDGTVIVRDDLDALLQVLPVNLRGALMSHEKRASLLEVVLDLGRRPEARFAGATGGEYLRDEEVTWEDLAAAEQAVGTFGGDNRAGVQGTLHRISAIRNRKGTVIGLTCRVGRAVTGHIDMIRDMLEVPNSVLFLGRPGVGKTTVIREMARVLSDELHKRVVIVDTSNEIGGDGDVPHPAIGGARRMQVPDPSQQHKVMVEAVENHMPEIVMVDEIGTEAEALACRTIAERGVQLVATAHGQLLENLIKNPTLSDLVGGIQSVTLGDEEARHRGTQKSVLERKAPPTFPLLIEMRERAMWVTHWVEDSVDCLLHGKAPVVQVRQRGKGKVSVEECSYPDVDEPLHDVPKGPRINSIPPAAMAAAAAAAGLEGISTNSSIDSDDSSLAGNSLLGPATFGSSFTSDDDPYAWAQKLRRIPDKDALSELALNGFIGEPALSGRQREKLVNGAGTGRRSKRNSKANARFTKP